MYHLTLPLPKDYWTKAFSLFCNIPIFNQKLRYLYLRQQKCFEKVQTKPPDVKRFYKEYSFQYFRNTKNDSTMDILRASATLECYFCWNVKARNKISLQLIKRKNRSPFCIIISVISILPSFSKKRMADNTQLYTKISNSTFSNSKSSLCQVLYWIALLRCFVDFKKKTCGVV